MPVEQQVVILYAATNGYLDSIEVDQIRAFEKDFLDHMRREKAEILEAIRETAAVGPEVEEPLKQAIADFKARFEA